MGNKVTHFRWSSKRAWQYLSLALLIIVLVLATLQVRHLLSDKQRVGDIPELPDGQGLYESCAPGPQDCLDRLHQMALAGFKLVVNYDQFFGSARDELDYADKAQASGIKIIWAMNSSAFWKGNAFQKYAKLAATCNCQDNVGFIRYVVNMVRNHPATWGYYIGDEADSSQHTQIKHFTDLLKQLDPTHPRLYIGSAAFPAGVAPALSPFEDTADVLGTDYYPVGRTDIPNAVNATAAIARAIQAATIQNNKQAAVVLQATSLGHYMSYKYLCDPFPSCVPYPTVDQMQLMRDLSLKNAHLRIILWYSYFDILKADNPFQRWENLIKAAGTPPG